MSLREKKKIETKNKIFEVSGRLFKEKGFENTTIDEVTKEAGIAKGTFFNYFPTKEALLLYFGEQKEALIYGLIENESMKNLSIKEKVKNILVFIAESCEKDKELTKLLIFESTKCMVQPCVVPDDEKCKDKIHRLTKIICVLLEEGAKNGDIKSNIDVKKAAEIISGVHFHSLIVWLKSESDISFSDDISVKIDMLFEGIGV
ncbi:MAG: TetR/AcrR family transcriptional regulator [ANME-2 cluster archaeon]|jgi:AcrR family transcriptional regulator|nr:TetR/AcrR family transcriptional regulator [ANME-2 cluster archaeon]